MSVLRDVRLDYHDWQGVRRGNVRRGGDLPKALRWAVRRVRRDDFQQHLVDRVDHEIDVRLFGFEDVPDPDIRRAFLELGVLSSNRRRGGPLDDDSGDEIDAATRAAVLDTLAHDRNFIRHLVKVGNALLRGAHLQHLEPLAARARGTLPRVEPPKAGLWNVASDLGMGDATVLESIPDEIAVWIAQAVIKTVKAGVILTVGDVTSAISKATAILDPTTKLLVDEVDTTGRPVEPEWYTGFTRNQKGRLERIVLNTDRQPSPCVRSRGPSLPASGSYVVAVVNIPAPALKGASRMRLHYKEDDPTGVAPPRDPGRMSELAWKAAVKRYIETAVGVIKPGGVLVLMLPAAYRGSHGYVDSPPLLDGLDDFIMGLRVKVVRRHEVVEPDPPSRPFVGRRTCQRLLIVGRTAA